MEEWPNPGQRKHRVKHWRADLVFYLQLRVPVYIPHRWDKKQSRRMSEMIWERLDWCASAFLSCRRGSGMHWGAARSSSGVSGTGLPALGLKLLKRGSSAQIARQGEEWDNVAVVWLFPTPVILTGTFSMRPLKIQFFFLIENAASSQGTWPSIACVLSELPGFQVTLLLLQFSCQEAGAWGTLQDGWHSLMLQHCLLNRQN